ncbi:MAG: hypothetical protein ACR2LM_09375 [Pyrinomonadaceae bacterium]
MKTTELFVEQVLIGFLVLLVAALVFWADLYAFLVRRSDKSLELLVTGGVLVGAAYLIGMVYDRVADTLLQDIESHGRLQFALARFKFKTGKVRTNEVKTEKIPADEEDVKDFDIWVAKNRDPFEDGKYRMMVLGSAEATAQMEYLRSRIRLTRAMTTIVGVPISARWRSGRRLVDHCCPRDSTVLWVGTFPKNPETAKETLLSTAQDL